MKKSMFVLVALLLAISVIPAAAGNDIPKPPSGGHYNLNIIGVPNDKNIVEDPDGNTPGNGHRIFVDLDRTGEKTQTRINLLPAVDDETFAVLDYDGTDGVAKFSLPVPATCPPDAAECLVQYSVWARALGKPGGKADMYTCATDTMGTVDPADDELYCSVDTMWVKFERDAGRPKWMDVTKQLLFVSANIDDDADTEHVPLFYSGWTDFYWQYDNYGLKLAQLRFYPGETTVVW